jgi:serine/threonine protein kinase
MLVGIPPFTDENKQALFKKIVHDEPSYNYFGEKVTVSKEAKDLISKLLAKRPKDRIKPEDIPFHPFFKDLSFDEIIKRKVKAPFVPMIVNLF